MINFRFTLSLLGVLAFTNIAVQAQSVIAAQQTTRGANRTVSLDMKEVPLRAALDEISRQAGEPIGISADAYNSSTKVSVQLRDLAFLDAVRAVIRGTNFKIETTNTGKLMVVNNLASRAKLQGIITGKVTDSKTGRWISGSNVSLDNDTRGVVSGSDGSYRISGVPTGTHAVTVRLVGYAKQTRTIMVGEGVTVTLDFKLEPSASVLDQVIVTGTIVSTELKAVPSAITVITAKDIERRGITRIDQLFRGEVPGLISLEQGAGTDLDEVLMFSRGATKITTSATSASEITNAIKTYVDGVQLADPRYLSQIDPKSIERIEILTGPQASTIYGSGAINGVMQVFTKRGHTSKPNITASFTEGVAQNNFSSALSSAHQYDGSVSGAEGKVSYSIGLGWDYTSAWTPGKQTQRTSVYGGSRYQSAILSVDLSARKGQTINKPHGASNYVLTAMNEDGRLNRNANTGQISPSKRFLNGRTFGISLGYVPLSWWSHQFNVGIDASNNEQFFFAPGFISTSDTAIAGDNQINSRTSQSYSSTLRFPVLSAVRTTITYGADHWRNRTAPSTRWNSQGPNQFTVTSTSRPEVTTAKNSGVYAQSQLAFWDALFITFGMRADWDPNYGEMAKVRPSRYGVSYTRDFGSVSAKLRGSYGRSITPPLVGAREGAEILPVSPSTSAQLAVFNPPGSILYSRLPAPELGPEFQQGGEGGMELYFGNRGSLIVTRYNQTVDGLVSNISGVDSVRAIASGFDPNSGTTSCDAAADLRSDGYCYLRQAKFINSSSIRNQGWELQGSVNMGPFTTRGTYSWTKSRVIGVTERYRSLFSNIQQFRPGQTFSFVPEHTWALNVSYAHENTSIALNVSGLGSSLRASNITDLNAVTTSSLRLRTEEVYRYFTLITEANNLRLAVPGYSTANINASQRFSSSLEATIQMTNLTNHYQNDFQSQYPTIGRQTRLGLRLRLN